MSTYPSGARRPKTRVDAYPPVALFKQGDTRWMDGALCAGADTELFFSDNPTDIAAAKSICSVCPVRSQCLRYALERPQLDGVWGGATRVERAEMRRTRRVTVRTAKACGPMEGTSAGYKRHHRAKERPCEACRDAYNRDRADRSCRARNESNAADQQLSAK